MEHVSAVSASIAGASDALRALSLSIHRHPELNFEERHAHAALTDYLASNGFRVERSAYDLETAFVARHGDGEPTIAILCEYDALPEIGHACGHNLIAIAGVAAGLGVKAALPADAGTLLVIGTPAEEGGGGKELLIQRGAFAGVRAAMMVHPSPGSSAYPTVVGVQEIEVEYFGRNAHAAMAPFEGLNALDALIMAYNGISMLRQQMRPDNRVHGVITKGGVKPNIIPDHTAAEFFLRAANDAETEELKAKVVAVLEGAAIATGCRLSYRWADVYFRDLLTNPPLAAVYERHAATLGWRIPPRGSGPLAKSVLSTDMGNVSYVTPSIHPMFAIPTTGGNHTPAFADAAATPEAHAATLTAAAAMALTAIDAFQRPELLTAAHDAFAARATD